MMDTNPCMLTKIFILGQTILPLMHCFGKGLGPDGIDVLIRIGMLSYFMCHCFISEKNGVNIIKFDFQVGY